MGGGTRQHAGKLAISPAAQLGNRAGMLGTVGSDLKNEGSGPT